MIISKIPFLLHQPCPGDVIAFLQPGYGVLIKRIREVASDGRLDVMGTHPDSIDSRIFGSVHPDHLLGKVIWHIRKA